ncbi:hypothetical protein BTH41_01574 [Bacillus mycoides]|nr:hypothetical protein BTH41_01574 [Bacillus mycoides]
MMKNEKIIRQQYKCKSFRKSFTDFTTMPLRRTQKQEK